MENYGRAVFAIFKSRSQVEGAVNALKREGFRHADISVLMPELGDTRSFKHEKSSKAPEGATAGVATGMLLGGAFGWLVGMGSIAIPGVGPFIAAGPILAALAGASLGAGLGGVTGALVGLGIPEYEAVRYEGFVKDGGILLSVHADNIDWIEKAEKILEREGGTDISATVEIKDFTQSISDTNSDAKDADSKIQFF